MVSCGCQYSFLATFPIDLMTSFSHGTVGKFVRHICDELHWHCSAFAWCRAWVCLVLFYKVYGLRRRRIISIGSKWTRYLVAESIAYYGLRRRRIISIARKSTRYLIAGSMAHYGLRRRRIMSVDSKWTRYLIAGSMAYYGLRRHHIISIARKWARYLVVGSMAYVAVASCL